MNLLSLERLTVDFNTAEGRIRAVDDVSFRIPMNRSVALVGESGSGKTVISQAIMGLLPSRASISSGQILLHDPLNPDVDLDIAKLAPDGPQMRAIRGNRIAMIFQEPMTSLSPLHTIGDQIGEAAQLHQGVSAPEARELTRTMLSLVQFPDPNRGIDAYPFELSGGLRQRAMIAMALICKPALLVADEPTTALDVTIQAETLKLIREIQHELNMSLLMITHDFGVVANMADDVVVIYHGKVMEKGSAEDLFREPKHDYLKALLNAVPSFGMKEGQRLVPIRPIKANLGSFLKNRAEECGSKTGNILQMSGVTKQFTSRKGGLLRAKPRVFTALDQVSLSVKRGECLGVVGESGSGKTTAALAMLRSFPVEEGTITFDKGTGPVDISTFNRAQMLDYRRRVQLIFQDPFSSLNPRMTVNDILMEPLIIHGIGTHQERQQRARELMDLVGLNAKYLRRYPHSFSGGQRQRIGIARALALNPEMILCDEPTSALDVSVQAQILNLLQDLKKELGLTYLFVSHNLAVVDYIADRIAVMCRGRLVEIGPTQSIVEAPIHPYTKALLSAVPEPSLDALLDFEHLDAMRASEPELWPEPFRLGQGVAPELVEVAPDHMVCAPGMKTKETIEMLVERVS
ncbi:ABC transporter ATP-binding protein [Pseudovibrio sp. SPO723]|uniref:ABC transporter ATP-binding protein n=1 Tax=Nesiotobacter zosterae TaxID=392721 RepID=UPI0029C31449|nr:ABC transporter ATP-binding protein [Pseudovibrio sp. SPO723]MDX5593562.1 ABC transporter ATP-binding protein [Pseudovibrio sp. SPO723]